MRSSLAILVALLGGLCGLARAETQAQTAPATPASPRGTLAAPQPASKPALAAQPFAPAPSQPAAATTVLVLKAGRDNSLAELKLGLYPLEEPLPAIGPTEQQRPSDVWRLKSLGLALRSDPAFECRRHASVEAALAADNRRQASGCLFAAELTLVVDKARRYQLSATCADWQDNVAACALVPGGGQFWVTRDGVTAPKRFNLVLGPSRNDVRFPPPQSGPAHAMLVKAAVMKPAGKAKPQGPVWLTWPEKSLTLKYVR